MPIRPDLKHLYRTPAARAAARAELIAARWRCRMCAAPEAALLQRIGGWWRFDRFTHFFPDSSRAGWWRDERGRLHKQTPARGRMRAVRIVLTVAHLDHDPSNNAPDNVRALCQWCHLHHDFEHHRDTRRARKDARRPLLVAIEEAIRASQTA